MEPPGLSLRQLFLMQLSVQVSSKKGNFYLFGSYKKVSGNKVSFGGEKLDYGLLVIGIALLHVSYLVAVKKQTWLLAGFNEKMVKNKSLLGMVTGVIFFLPLGMLVVVNSFIDYPYELTVLIIAMLILLTIVYVFINRRLLD